MTNENRCEPPPEWQLMAYECVPPQVVADDLLGVLADLAHNPTADATIINTLRRARANVQTFTPPATVAALVEALEVVALAAEPWPPASGQVVARNPTARDWRDRLDDIHKTARAALALYREAGR